MPRVWFSSICQRRYHIQRIFICTALPLCELFVPEALFSLQDQRHLAIRHESSPHCHRHIAKLLVVAAEDDNFALRSLSDQGAFAPRNNCRRQTPQHVTDCRRQCSCTGIELCLGHQLSSLAVRDNFNYPCPSFFLIFLILRILFDDQAKGLFEGDGIELPVRPVQRAK